MSARNWARDKAIRQGRATHSERLAADAHMRAVGQQPWQRPQLSKAELRAQLAAAMARSKKAAGV